jgi:1-acyl-sn-glycerol-3-phosphate acyltransferase
LARESLPETVVGEIRYRLIFLWVSQAAQALADHGLRAFLLWTLARTEGATSWPLVVALFMAPAVALSPLIGAVVNTCPRCRVVPAASGFCFLVILLYALRPDLLAECCMLLAAGIAFYAPARSALLPAAARDARIPLARLNAWMELGNTGGAVGGMVLGTYYFFNDPDGIRNTLVVQGLIAFLAALAVRFPGDVPHSRSARQALADFFRNSKRVLGSREPRRLLILMTGFRGLVAVLVGLLLAPTLDPVVGRSGDVDVAEPIQAALWLAVGVVAGLLFAGMQGHPRRSLGLMVFGATGFAATLLASAFGGSVSSLAYVFLGLTASFVNAPLMAGYQDALPATARGHGMAFWRLTTQLSMAALAGLTFVLLDRDIVSLHVMGRLVAALAVLGAVLAWWFFLREGLEQLTEVLIWPLYRIRARGPGLFDAPGHGPLLLIANHTAWMDPLWLAKAVPRQLTGMLTSNFYDLAVLGWVFKDVVKTIRVQASTFRREAPELQLAVDALDRGECVMVFPEGAMRRKEEIPLKMFGQGVWHILQQRPTTPVLVCWIEGGWGSYFSYFQGLPTKNKRLDFWRRIDVAVAPPRLLDASVLANHRATRHHLMQACLEARQYLGLEPLKRDQTKQDDDV